MAFFIIETCIGCRACKKVCPAGAVTGELKSLHKIDPDLCIECGACGRVCPKTAVLDDQGIPVPKQPQNSWKKPHILINQCYACENCVAACPADALAMKSETLPLTENHAVLVRPDLCVSCGWCFGNCQFDAIIMEVPVENN